MTATSAALSNLNGINIYYGTITLLGNASIGVTADPNPTNTANYFTNDFSLTIEPPGAGAGTLIGTAALTKEGGGQLIVPTANDSFQGNWFIAQGWVTVENNDSLGLDVPSRSQSAQPVVTVRPNAALMLNALGGTTLNLHQNFVLSGTGVTHPFSEIDQQGAIENIDGINSIEGNIKFTGPAGIGVNPVFGPSQLSLLGEQSQPAGGIAIPVGANASGSSAENDNVIDTGATSGTITINYNMYYIPDTINVYYGVKGAGGIDIQSTGPLSGSSVLTVPYAPIGSFSTTTVEIVLDQGGGPSGTAWTYTATITPNTGTLNNTINKLGSGLLDIQGDGTFTGPTIIQEGVLLDQNDSGLGLGGAANSTVTVQPGAALALGNSTAYNSGGVEGGIQVNGAHLVVNTNANLQTVTIDGSLLGSFGLTFAGLSTGPLSATIPAAGGTGATASLQNALEALATQAAGAKATVTVTQTGDTYDVVFGGALAGTTQKLSVTPASITNATTTVTIGGGLGNSTLGATGGAVRRLVEHHVELELQRHAVPVERLPRRPDDDDFADLRHGRLQHHHPHRHAVARQRHAERPSVHRRARQLAPDHRRRDRRHQRGDRHLEPVGPPEGRQRRADAGRREHVWRQHLRWHQRRRHVRARRRSGRHR